MNFLSSHWFWKKSKILTDFEIILQRLYALYEVEELDTTFLMLL